MAYLHNPDLPFVRQDYQGNILVNGLFSNEGNIKEVPLRDVLRWQLGKNPQKQQKKAEKKGDFRLPIQQSSDLFEQKDDVIVWLGHASFLLRLGGKTLLFDPCLEDLPFIPRLVEKPYAYEQMRDIDYILLSHAHRDHLDLKSLKSILKFNPKAQFLTGLRIGSLLEKKLKTQYYQEAGWWQAYQLGEGLRIIYLPARHWHRRGLLDYNKMLWGSFWIQYQDTSIYFAGDTANWGHFGEIREVLGQPDIALMPIGAYKPQFIMSHAHVNPQESVAGFNQLGAKWFVPMHYGTYDLSDELLSEPIITTRQLAETGELQGNLKELAVGEPFYFSNE